MNTAFPASAGYRITTETIKENTLGLGYLTQSPHS